MDEAMVENLSSLANLVLTYGGTLVIAEGLDILAITAVALNTGFSRGAASKKNSRRLSQILSSAENYCP
jgi:hypothetical protein